MPATTAGGRCALTDLPAYSCGHCTGAEARARAAEARHYPAGTVTTARFPGSCLCCGDPIAPGQAIRADPDGGGWTHDDCEAP